MKGMLLMTYVLRKNHNKRSLTKTKKKRKLNWKGYCITISMNGTISYHFFSFFVPKQKTILNELSGKQKEKETKLKRLLCSLFPMKKYVLTIFFCLFCPKEKSILNEPFAETVQIKKQICKGYFVPISLNWIYCNLFFSWNQKKKNRRKTKWISSVQPIRYQPLTWDPWEVSSSPSNPLLLHLLIPLLILPWLGTLLTMDSLDSLPM